MIKHVLYIITFLALTQQISAQVPTTGSMAIGASLAYYPSPGVSMIYWLNQDWAVDGFVSLRLSEDDSHIYLGADMLQQYYGVVSTESGIMPLYWGFGPYIETGGDGFYAIRFPLGISYIEAKHDFQVFAEITPTLQINGSNQFFFGGAIGVRLFI